MGPDAKILVFECWVLSQLFHSLTFIKRLFSSSSLSAMRMASSAHLRLLIFLPAILIPACAPSTLHFSWCTLWISWINRMTAYNLYILFPILNQAFVPYLLTVASWPACRFLMRKVRWSGMPISWRIFHSLLPSTQSKALVNEAKIDGFLEFSCFFMIQQMLEIWSLVPLAFLNPACTSGNSHFTPYSNLSWRIWALPC